ncbi:wall-associated receptor kinase-like 20 [Argentina anserina]|uniref:wall-associated receptor kinase-like 20 n=1 Tax=Argentina anserina TaxID=57926 RepID=UPI0021768959|nr:wall-associated receptor kinase-like 20 [Potentilla anserina]
MVISSRSRVLQMMLFVVIMIMFTKIEHVSAEAGACPKCGSLEVPYPFSTDASCGDARYKIYCSNGNELQFMSAEGFKYKILSIDTSTNIILPPDLLVVNNNTPTCYSSDFSSQGLRLDEQLPFNISTRNTVMLLNCSDNLLRSPLNCSSHSFCRQFEDKIEACRGTLCCHFLKDSRMTSYMIRVRLGGCTAYTSVVDMQPHDPVDNWNYGIELHWLPPN